MLQKLGPSGHQIIPFIREEDEFEEHASQLSNIKKDVTPDDEQMMKA